MTKKEKIMESAIRLFCVLGFQNTSTTKITKDAGVGTGTLFLYFKSKDDLVNALYLEIKREMQVYHTAFADENLSFKERLQRFWYDIVNWGVQHQQKFKFMMQFKNSPYITQLTKDEVSEEHQVVKNVMEKAIANGDIIDLPFDFLMTVFTGQFTSIIQYLSTQKPGNHKAMITSSFIILWNGIKKI